MKIKIKAQFAAAMIGALASPTAQAQESMKNWGDQPYERACVAKVAKSLGYKRTTLGKTAKERPNTIGFMNSDGVRYSLSYAIEKEGNRETMQLEVTGKKGGLTINNGTDGRGGTGGVHEDGHTRYNKKAFDKLNSNVQRKLDKALREVRQACKAQN